MPVPEGRNEDGPPHWKGETGAFLGGGLTVLLVTVCAPGMPHVLDLGALIGAVLGGVRCPVYTSQSPRHRQKS
ncbi:hypothetical protein CLM82_23720, partial [Streptomyces albidoflavus]|uniref:hypothetical protein n=1 Tax=Streptomyces albidoflavus TaxID=1886 RepID=UPI000BAE5EAF